MKYLISVIKPKKTDHRAKNSEIENKITTDHDNDKYIDLIS